MRWNKQIMPVVAALLLSVGCIESQSVKTAAPFEDQRLDACLAIIVDMSGSFRSHWDDRAYELFLDLSDRYFNEAMGADSKLIIGQLSGTETVVLFEGRPEDLRQKFGSPEELNQFLLDNSSPDSSRVYDATRKAVDYISGVSGITDETRVLTVIMSDMRDSSEYSVEGTNSKEQMMESLKRYQSEGGALALYFVANEQARHWQSLLNEAGFEPGHYVIENDLVAKPQLPRFD